MQCPKCGSDKTKRNGAGRMRCADCFGTFNALRRPESGALVEVPDGYMAKGTSTLVRADGTIVQQWVKTTADMERQREMQLAALDAMAAKLPRVKPRAPKQGQRTDILVAYPMGDPHFGMLAWPDETGEDWNLEIARQVHCDAMDALVSAAPASETALVVNLGDALHFDGMAAVTPRSGHQLDADGRYAKIIDVAVITLRQCIESALRKHARVHVINVRGNHDESGALWLARLLAALYENEPRVTVDTNPSVFNYHRFGRCLIGMHHGHTCKPDKLPGVMASDRARDWGEATWRYWWQGHIHHESKREYPGVSVESFNTLAAKDAYASEGGWRSARLMQAIVLHETHGEVGRVRVNAAMFDRVAA